MKTKKESRTKKSLASTVTPRNARIALNQESALKPEVATDYKSRAANDDTKPVVMPGLSSTGTPAPAAPKAKKQKRNTPAKEATQPQTAAGSACTEGIRLEKLSNVVGLAK